MKMIKIGKIQGYFSQNSLDGLVGVGSLSLNGTSGEWVGLSDIGETVWLLLLYFGLRAAA